MNVYNMEEGGNAYNCLYTYARIKIIDMQIEQEDRHKNSREKWRKRISVTGSLRGQAQVRPIDELDEVCTNADDLMMLVQHRSADRVMS